MGALILIPIAIIFVYWRFFLKAKNAVDEKKGTLTLGNPVNTGYSAIFRPTYNYNMLELDTANGLLRVGTNGDIISIRDVNNIYASFDDVYAANKTAEYQYVDVISSIICGKIVLHINFKNGQSVAKVLNQKVNYPASQKGRFNDKQYYFDHDPAFITLKMMLDTCMYQVKNNISTFEEAKRQYDRYVKNQFAIMGFSGNQDINASSMEAHLKRQWEKMDQMGQEEKEAYNAKLIEAKDICYRYARGGSHC